MSGTQMPFAVTGDVARGTISGVEFRRRRPPENTPALVRRPALGRDYDLTPAIAVLILRRHWTSQRPGRSSRVLTFIAG